MKKNKQLIFDDVLNDEPLSKEKQEALSIWLEEIKTSRDFKDIVIISTPFYEDHYLKNFFTMNKLFRQVKTKEENPTTSGWYNTDKGLLYYFEEEKQWSCREDRISEEYPTLWYKNVEYGCTSKAVKEGYKHCNICSGNSCKDWGLF